MQANLENGDQKVTVHVHLAAARVRRHCGTTDLNFHKLEPAGNFHSSQGTTYYATDLLPVRENKRASATDNLNRRAHTCVLADHRHDVGHCSGAVEVSAQTASC